VAFLKMATKAAMGGTGLINKWIYDPLMCFLLVGLFDEIGAHARNILQKSEAKVRMTVVLCYPRKRLKSLPT